MDLFIKQAVPEAAVSKKLSALHLQCFERGWDEASLLSTMDGTGVFTLMTDDASGMLVARVVGEESELLTLCTHKNARRQGVGKELLKEAFRYCRALGVEEMFLEVAEDNLAAIRLYEHAGFVTVSRRKGYYPRQDGAVDALNMRLKL